MTPHVSYTKYVILWATFSRDLGVIVFLCTRNGGVQTQIQRVKGDTKRGVHIHTYTYDECV